MKNTAEKWAWNVRELGETETAWEDIAAVKPSWEGAGGVMEFLLERGELGTFYVYTPILQSVGYCRVSRDRSGLLGWSFGPTRQSVY